MVSRPRLGCGVSSDGYLLLWAVEGTLGVWCVERGHSEPAASIGRSFVVAVVACSLGASILA